MDIISHGLWGSAAFGRKNKKTFLIAFLIGLAPDMFSFGILFVYRIILRLGFLPEPSISLAPAHFPVPIFVYSLYNITHSLIIFALFFGAIWLIFKKPFWPILAWGLHILVDIPSHSFDFFPTPFLWPISNFKFDGIGWGNPIIFFPNVILLLAVYGFLFLRKRKKKKIISSN
ncbi:MAG TPA: hypothetical protein P5232_01540 [Candidatus Moranbacteria bacterium]|nr:hypothetical protein [Candidatus Moranbacteria bacterium]